jgi:two-component system, LytTR family, response regulator
MQTIRSVIVDDEELARGIVREFLTPHSDIEIIAECSNGFEAVKAITELKPDLVFLDIQMPKLNGLEVLELVDKNLSVIFVTAYDQYAVRAFEVHAIDYLLKPFTKQRFDEALGRARSKIAQNETAPFSEIVADARPRDVPLERVLVREGSKVHVLPIDRIDYVEAQDDYIAIRSEGKTHLKQQRLTELESSLDQKRFVRIHRSYILNVDRLARLELYAKDSRMAVLKDGTKLPVSRSGYEKLKGLL